MQLAGVGSGCTVAQLQESVWRGVGTLGAGKYSPACLGVREALSVSRGFLELLAGPLRSPWRSDAPEIPRYSNREFAPIGADAGHQGPADL